MNVLTTTTEPGIGSIVVSLGGFATPAPTGNGTESLGLGTKERKGGVWVMGSVLGAAVLIAMVL